MKRKEKNNKTKKKRIKLIIATSLIVVFLYLFVFGMKTVKYNQQVDFYNIEANKYNELSNQIAVYNIEGYYDSVPIFEHAKINPFSLIASRFKGNTINKIKKDTLTVGSLINELKEKIVIMPQLKCPNEEWVIKKLNEIETISGIQFVDKSNNPDGILGREGGYKACIYFSLSEVDQERVPGKTIVDKGTDCGGCIEIYESKNNAEERCTYLSGFDDTVLYSGSYAIVGTMVIRTSYLLDNETQFNITNAITKKLTEKE